MALTFLQIVQQAMSEVGLASPQFAIGNPDALVGQTVALAQSAAQELAEESTAFGGWQQLRKVYTFNLNAVGPYTGTITAGSTTISGLSSVAGITVGMVVDVEGVHPTSAVTAVGTTTVTMSIAATSTATGSINFSQTAYPVPSADYGWFLPETAWNTAFFWEMVGPLNPNEWFKTTYGITPTGPRMRWKLDDNKVIIQPAPDPGQTDMIVFAYISKNWCQSALSVAQSRWLKDTDTFLLDELSLIYSLKYRIRQAKGLNFTSEYRDFTRRRDKIKARNGVARTLPLNASGQTTNLISNANVPDSGFGS